MNPRRRREVKAERAEVARRAERLEGYWERKDKEAEEARIRREEKAAYIAPFKEEFARIEAEALKAVVDEPVPAPISEESETFSFTENLISPEEFEASFVPEEIESESEESEEDEEISEESEEESETVKKKVIKKRRSTKKRAKK